MKIEIDVNRWLDPSDNYAIELLAPGSAMLPLVESVERMTLVNLVDYLRTHRRDDARVVPLVLEAIDETCGAAMYRDVVRELSEREPLGDLIKGLGMGLLLNGERTVEVGAA
jgi:hypothetical protein